MKLLVYVLKHGETNKNKMCGTWPLGRTSRPGDSSAGEERAQEEVLGAGRRISFEEKASCLIPETGGRKKERGADRGSGQVAGRSFCLLQ